MWMCSSLGLRQYLREILKSNQPLMHTNLFVFERASRRYLSRLNRSSVEEVMAVIRTLRCPEIPTRPGELLPYNSTRPGGVIMPARFQRVPKKSHPAGCISSGLIPPGRVRHFGVFQSRNAILEEENKKEELGQFYSFSTCDKTHALFL